MVADIGARPHPGRGSATTGRPRRATAIPMADSRDARPVEDDHAILQARVVPGHAAPVPCPGSRRAARRRAGRAPARAAARATSAGRRRPRTTGSATRSGCRRPAERSRACRRVYDGPGRSSSTRLTANAGLSAMAASTIASRSAAGRDRLARLVRRHARRDEQHALQPEAVAGRLGDREVGEVDRVERAAEDARAPRRPPVTARSHGSGSHSSSVAPIRTRSPGTIPARRSPVSIPSRARSRWKRSADSSTSKLVWAAMRSMRVPRTRKTPSSSGSIVKPSPMASMRWTTTPAGSGGSLMLGRVGQQLGEPGAERLDALAGRRGHGDRPSSPSASRLRRKSGHASAAAGRSTLLNAMSIGFARSAGSCASSSSRMTSWSHSGSRDDPSTTWTRIRVRSTWRRNSWPSPSAGARALDQPGHVGDRRPALVLARRGPSRRGSARAS